MKSVVTFSFKDAGRAEKLRADGCHVIDCRELANPWGVPALRHLSGRDDRVVAYILAHSERGVVEELLGEASKHDLVAFGCYGGVHRSVVMARLFNERKGGASGGVEESQE